jgi:surface polysaccharide O-acyltransferase-like enzyme
MPVQESSFATGVEQERQQAMGPPRTTVPVGASASPPATTVARGRRLAHVETIRGLTCLLVCLFHAIGDSPQHGLHLPVGSWAWTLARILDVVNMPLFTFVAGRVFWIRPEIPGGYLPGLARKLVRLMVPFVTVTTLWLIATAAFGRISASEAVDFYLHARGHLWFLQALAWLTLFATIGFALFPKAIYEFAWIATIVSILAAFLLSNGAASVLSWQAAFDLMPYYFLGLTLGAAQRTGRASFEGMRSPFTFVVFGVFLAVGIWLTALQPDPFRALEGPTAFWFLTSMPFLVAMIAWAPQSTFLQRIARYSYTIYLFHVFVMAAVRVPLLAVVPEPPLVPTIVLLLIVGVIVPIGLDRVIVRSRLLQLLFHGLATRRGAPAAVGGA